MKRLLMTAAVIGLATAGPAAAEDGVIQSADGSIGTVQVAGELPDVDASATAPTTVSLTEGVTTEPAATAAVATHAAGAATQTADRSVGTVQVSLPAKGAQAAATAPTSVEPTRGVSSRPAADATVTVHPAEGATQTADQSVGTVQIGPGGGQSARDSVGTVQAAWPALDAHARMDLPLDVDLTRGVVVAPHLAVGITLDPPAAGDQTATGSIGTVQIGGGGNQAADESVGTVQVSVPALDGGAILTAPTDADLTEGVTSAPAADAGLASEPGPAGDQTATDSVGTVQIGGGGDQTAADSVGTVQAGGGSREISGGNPPTEPAGGTASTAGSVSPVPATGGSGSAPTRKQKPTATGSQPFTPPVAGGTALERMTRVLTQRSLPFTGMPLWLLALVGTAGVLLGTGVLRSAPAR